MNTITRVRLYIKKHYPALYTNIRTQLFPLVQNSRKKSANKFTHATTKKIQLENISFLLQIDPQNGFVDRTIFTTGIYEPDILKVIKDNLSPGDSYIDIGANIGLHTLLARSIVGDSGSVTAFEPIPRLVSQIQSSLELNTFSKDNVTIHQIGCSDTKATATLTLNPTNIGGSSMHTEHKTSHQQITITLDTADTYLVNSKKVDFIKIDTEGHEYEVLLGLQNTLEKFHPKIIFEFSPVFRSDKSINTKTISYLNELGYTLYDLESGGKKITDTQTWAQNFVKKQTNLLCLFEPRS